MAPSAWLRRAPALGWAVLIFTLSSRSTLGGMPLFAGADKLIHAAAYAIFAALLLLAGLSGRAALVVAVLYGISDELHQSFVPGRQAELLDAVSDAGGALLTIALWHRHNRTQDK